MTTQDEAAKPYVCDVPGCGRRFTRKQGLGRHLKEGHGRKATRDVKASRAAAAAVVESPGVLALRAQLHELGEPLREQLRQVEARLEVLDAEARELRAMRTQLGGVLGKLDAKPKPPSKGMPTAAVVANRARADRELVEKTDAVEAWLLAHRDELRDGFTANVVANTANGVPHGLSSKTAQQVLEILRERGVVRADRVTKGGGMSFKLLDEGAAV